MITTAEEYKQALLDIQQGTTVVHTTLPATEPRFHVDLDTRTITIPDEFKFLATKKETKAETIYFVCDRYFDDIDLFTKTCVVQWINTDGSTTNRGLYPVTELDVDSIDGKIVFGWQIQSESTQIPGKIEFAITFYKIGEDELGENVFKYNLTTLATSSLILDTLDVWGSTTTPSMMPTELQVWLNQVNSIAKEANDNNNDTKAKIKEFNDAYPSKLDEINTLTTNSKTSIEELATNKKTELEQINADIVEDVSQLKEDLAEIDLQINGESGEYIFNWQIGYISNTNGSTIYTSKDKICTKDGEFYSFDPNLQNLIITIPDGYNLLVFIYDENNTYVNATGYSATDSPKNFPIKSTMKYRYAIIKSGESVGDVKWANDISFKNTMIDHSGTIAEKVETLIGEVNALKPVQNIVKLLTLGDSITALGTGERGWIKYFIEKTNATLVANVAVNSAKLADDSNTVLDGNPTQTSNNTLSNQVQKVINNTYDEPDIIIIAIGTNNGIAITKQNMIDVFYDSDKQLKPLDEVDRTTDYGAFRWCFEKLHSLYPNAQIFWSTPIHGAQTMRRAERIIDCRESLQIATEYVGCVMIDSVRCGINGINEIMNTNGEYLIDGLHTNVNGAKKLGYYIASKVKPFIGNNFEEIN